MEIWLLKVCHVVVLVFRTKLGKKSLNYYSCLHLEIRRHGFGTFPGLQKREKVRARHFQTSPRGEKPQGLLRKVLVSVWRTALHGTLRTISSITLGLYLKLETKVIDRWRPLNSDEPIDPSGRRIGVGAASSQGVWFLYRVYRDKLQSDQNGIIPQGSEKSQEGRSRQRNY